MSGLPPTGDEGGVVGDHPHDLLSALLDGELDPATAAAVRAHVAACDDCAVELDDVRAARRLLRSLPAVSPPEGAIPLPPEGVPIGAGWGAGPPTPGRWAGLGVAAAVVLGVLLVGLGGRPLAPVAPELAAAVDRHVLAGEVAGHGGAGRIEALGAADAGAEEAGALELRPVDDLPGGFVAPAELVGYRFVAAYDLPGDAVHVVYEKGTLGLSLFERVGRLDPDALPPDAVRDGDLWRWEHPATGGRVVVAQRGDVVVVVVGDESADVSAAAAQAVPEGHRSGLGTRLLRGCDRVLEALNPLR